MAPFSTRRAGASALALGSLLSLAGRARANGLEIPDNGTVAMGRGGAFAARASDPTALIHNVAGIVGLPGFQLALGTNVGFFSHCFQREGNYPSENESNITNAGTVFENSTYANGSTPYPRACNDASVGVTPSLLMSYRINRFVAVGLGVWGPSTTGSAQNYPETVMTASGQLAPSPVRNMIYRKALLLFHPSLAVAVAPTWWLRLGFTVEPSFASFNLTTMANTNGGASQSPDSDLRLGLAAEGWFFAGSAGVQILPSPYLSFGAHFHANGTPHLTGTGTATSSPYASDMSQQRTSTFRIDRMTVEQPWNARVAVRFSLPRPGHPTQTDFREDRRYDPMVDDVFDLEAQFNYENTSALSASIVETSGNIVVGNTQVPSPPRSEVRGNYNDVLGFRFGGDVNVVPGVLALRAGMSYDTAGASNEFAQLHIVPYQSVGLNGGASVRWRSFTLHAGYGHYFLSDNVADRGTRRITGTGGAVTDAQCATAGQGACMINRGTYQATFDMVSVALTGAF